MAYVTTIEELVPDIVTALVEGRDDEFISNKLEPEIVAFVRKHGHKLDQRAMVTNEEIAHEWRLGENALPTNKNIVRVAHLKVGREENGFPVVLPGELAGTFDLYQLTDFYQTELQECGDVIAEDDGILIDWLTDRGLDISLAAELISWAEGGEYEEPEAAPPSDGKFVGMVAKRKAPSPDNLFKEVKITLVSINEID